MRRAVFLTASLLIGLAGCSDSGGETSDRAKMTQRQRDSVIAESRLPGAGVVRKAISMSDAQAQRAAMMDSASQQP